jgi:hypothetical protein
VESNWLSLLNSPDFGWPRQRDEETRRKVFREQEAKELVDVEERSLETGLAFLGTAVVGFQRYRNAAALVQVGWVI